MRGCVIAGIGTGVGKTVTAAIVVQHHHADYWKPVQAGGLSNTGPEYGPENGPGSVDGGTDSHAVRLLAPGLHKIHPEAYRLTAPMSPHAAAAIDNVAIEAGKLELPQTSNFLVVEVAGGLMVPLQTHLTNIDLIRGWGLPVVLVCNFYLGSINHTLLSITALEHHDIEIAGLVFNGEAVESSRSVILERTGLRCLLDIETAPVVDSAFVARYAEKLQYS
jgi:dethiobiotin synthetase